MKGLSLITLIVGGSAICLGADLPRSSPEAQGVSSAAVLSFVEAADRDLDALHSFMLVRHGHVVAEGWWSPYNAQSPHAPPEVHGSGVAVQRRNERRFRPDQGAPTDGQGPVTAAIDAPTRVCRKGWNP